MHHQAGQTSTVPRKLCKINNPNFLFFINVFIGSFHLCRVNLKKRPAMPKVLHTAWTHVLSDIVIALDHISQCMLFR